MTTLFELRQIRDRLVAVHDSSPSGEVARHVKVAIIHVEEAIQVEITRLNPGGKP